VPVVVTVKLPAAPVLKVTWSADVILGTSSTLRVNDSEKSGAMPLLATTVIGSTPSVPAAGVPDRSPSGLLLP
jgi:hypothetical protein